MGKYVYMDTVGTQNVTTTNKTMTLFVYKMTSSNGKHFPRYWPFLRGIHRTLSFDVFFDLRLNRHLSKQWRRWWFETLPRSLWRHYNEPTECTASIWSPLLPHAPRGRYVINYCLLGEADVTYTNPCLMRQMRHMSLLVRWSRYSICHKMNTHSSRLLHWHRGNSTISPSFVK